MSLKLRPLQESSVERLRDGIRSGIKRQLLVGPCGFGKTEVIAAVLRGAAERGKRAAVICNRVTLVGQTSDRLSKYGISHGVIQAENTRGAHSSVIVASLQTVARRGLGEFDIYVFDEAHMVPGSKDAVKIVTEAPGKVVLGFTATPFSRGMAKQFDGLDGPLFERVVVGATTRQLIDDGLLVDCDVYAPSAPDMAGVRLVLNAAGERDYSDKDASSRANTPKLVGDIVEHWRRLANGTLTIAFGCDIAHSMAIRDAFLAAGIPAAHVDAYTTGGDREEVYRRFRAGEIRVLCNVSVLAEGFDVPECSTMILARPTRSLIRYIQQCGRVLRIAEGKQKALILDHSGSCLKLGMPTEDREIVLNDGRPAESTYRKEDEKDKLRPCPRCGYVDHYRAMFGNKECPKCGFVAQRQPKEVLHVDGRLQKIKESVSLDQKQRFWSELLYICDERGYKPGWAANKYREKFGVWPRGLFDSPIQATPEVRSWVRSRQIRYAKAREKEMRSVAAA